MGKITKQLQDERKKIDAVIKCAQHALRRRPGDKTAKECLRFSEAKLKLVQHLEIRHKGLLVVMLAVICLAFSGPPMPLKPVLRSPKDQANQPVSPVRPGLLQAAPAGLRRVTLAYDLQPVDGYTQWGLETGLSASTNLVNWSVVWLEPYPTATHVQVTLSNQPPYCFYRAFWRRK